MPLLGYQDRSIPFECCAILADRQLRDMNNPQDRMYDRLSSCRPPMYCLDFVSLVNSKDRCNLHNGISDEKHQQANSQHGETAHVQKTTSVPDVTVSLSIARFGVVKVIVFLDVFWEQQ